ncbi:MAG: hypothetical protein ACRCWQ_10950 [Bacilli bacterium]
MALVLLSGCTTNQHIELKRVNYPLPAAVEPANVKWKVITKSTIQKEKDDVVYISLSYDDSIKHRQWLEKLASYIEKQRVIICNLQECVK